MATLKQKRRLLVWMSAIAGIFAFGAVETMSTPVDAMGSPNPNPPPASNARPSCEFGQSYSKKKRQCVAVKDCAANYRWSSYYGDCVRKRSDALTDRELYKEARWLLEDKHYAEARELLLTIRDQNDPKVLNYIGYTTRKLGDVDAGLVYYAKALAIDPDLNIAREYLGEGYLQKGNLGKAKEQLAEIARRCGTACVEYEELAAAIGSYILGEPVPETW